MERHVSYPRRRFREHRRDFLVRNWRGLTVLVAVLIVVGVLETALLDGYLLGFMHGILGAGALGMVAVSLLTNSPETQSNMKGAWGEEATRDELKRARRRKLIWSSVDGVAIQGGDIDHLVITRAAGLLAFDSKWHSSVTPEVLDRDAQAALSAARRANHVLRAEKVPAKVRPVIVIWGSGRNDIPDHVTSRQGVDVVKGEQLLAWLRTLNGEVVDEPTARELHERLVRFRARVRPEWR